MSRNSQIFIFHKKKKPAAFSRQAIYASSAAQWSQAAPQLQDLLTAAFAFFLSDKYQPEHGSHKRLDKEKL